MHEDTISKHGPGCCSRVSQVSDLKVKLQELDANMEVSRQRLIFKGKVLKDEDTIESTGVTENDFFVCMVNKVSIDTPLGTGHMTWRTDYCARGGTTDQPKAAPKAPAPAPAPAPATTTTAAAPAPAPSTAGAPAPAPAPATPAPGKRGHCVWGMSTTPSTHVKPD